MLLDDLTKLILQISYTFIPIGSFLWQKPEERIQRSADKLLFADRYSNAVKAEKIGVFICSFDEVSQEVLRSSFHLWKFHQLYQKLSL